MKVQLASPEELKPPDTDPELISEILRTPSSDIHSNLEA